MILSVYSVKDEKSGFNNPVVGTNDAIAIRDFQAGCVNQASMLNKFPEDFNLYRIGTFDTETGFVFTTDPVCVSKAVDFVSKE